MTKKAFDKIAEGLNEALAIARGEATPSKLRVPPEIDVRAIRAKTKLSQDDFAAVFGFTVHQIRQWEQCRNRPTGAVRVYLLLINGSPMKMLELLRDTEISGRNVA